MRIFWLNHGLHVDPESEAEARMLISLVEDCKFTTKEKALAEQESAEVIVGDSQAIPS